VHDIQVLTPTKKGPTGTIQLNKLLQEVLNPPKTGRAEKKFGERIFRSGDKIMQIKNNYQMKWKTDDEQRGEGVFNGDIGFIEGMNLADQKVVVRFDDGRTVHYDFSQLDEIIHAYAVTVHKSQGSEFPVLVMPIWSGPPMLMNRNILYTAVTRAKQLVVLVGDRRYLNIMVNNENQNERLSGLKFRLEGIVKEEFIV
jgi:exodeoxyribonuclease V alpha subunit